MVTIISVVRNFDMYDRLVRKNKFCEGAEFVAYDNRLDNVPMSVRYNCFIDSYDYTHEGWFVFCHEDFEMLEKLVGVLSCMNKNALCGVVGGRRNGFAGFGMQVIYGNMVEKRRDGSGDMWNTGRHITHPIEVEAFDCCCLIVHSSLVKHFGLRFDEALEFDLYVEDFCAAAKVKHDLRSIVYPVGCCHHSGSRASERLYRHLPYLAQKYPKEYFVGTLTYFGTPDWRKLLQDRIVGFIRKNSRR